MAPRNRDDQLLFQLHSLLEFSNEGLCVFDDEGYFTLASPFLRTFLGIGEHEDITSVNILDLYNADSKAQVLAECMFKPHNPFSNESSRWNNTVMFRNRQTKQSFSATQIIEILPINNNRDNNNNNNNTTIESQSDDNATEKRKMRKGNDGEIIDTDKNSPIPKNEDKTRKKFFRSIINPKSNIESPLHSTTSTTTNSVSTFQLYYEMIKGIPVGLGVWKKDTESGEMILVCSNSKAQSMLESKVLKEGAPLKDSLSNSVEIQGFMETILRENKVTYLESFSLPGPDGKNRKFSITAFSIPTNSVCVAFESSPTKPISSSGSFTTPNIASNVQIPTNIPTLPWNATFVSCGLSIGVLEFIDVGKSSVGIVECNSVFETLRGQNRKDILGSDFFSLFESATPVQQHLVSQAKRAIKDGLTFTSNEFSVLDLIGSSSKNKGKTTKNVNRIKTKEQRINWTLNLLPVPSPSSLPMPIKRFTFLMFKSREDSPVYNNNPLHSTNQPNIAPLLHSNIIQPNIIIQPYIFENFPLGIIITHAEKLAHTFHSFIYKITFINKIARHFFPQLITGNIFDEGRPAPFDSGIVRELQETIRLGEGKLLGVISLVSARDDSSSPTLYTVRSFPIDHLIIGISFEELIASPAYQGFHSPQMHPHPIQHPIPPTHFAPFTVPSQYHQSFTLPSTPPTKARSPELIPPETALLPRLPELGSKAIPKQQKIDTFLPFQPEISLASLPPIHRQNERHPQSTHYEDRHSTSPFQTLLPPFQQHNPHQQTRTQSIPQQPSPFSSKQETTPHTPSQNSLNLFGFHYSVTGYLFCDYVGRVYHVNRTVCNMLGYSDSELKNTNIASLSLRDDIDELSTIIYQLYIGEMEIVEGMRRFVHRNGQAIWSLVTMTFYEDPSLPHSSHSSYNNNNNNNKNKNKVGLVMIQIQKRPSLYPELSLDKDILGFAFRELSVGMIVMDLHGRMLVGNDVFHNLMKTNKTEIGGKYLADLFSIKEKEKIHSSLHYFNTTSHRQQPHLLLSCEYHPPQRIVFCFSAIRDSRKEPFFLVAETQIDFET